MRTILTAAVLLLAPAALAAQTPAETRRYESMYRTWTIDSVLVALASDTETRQAASAATAILRGSGGRRWKQVEGIGSPLSRARLGDAFRPKVPGFFEMCDFIGDLAPPFGTLAVVNGQPVFTFHEGVDLSPMSDGRQPTKEEYDALDDATNELYEAGVIDSPCPHPGYPPGASFYTKTRSADEAARAVERIRATPGKSWLKPMEWTPLLPQQHEVEVERDHGSTRDRAASRTEPRAAPEHSRPIPSDPPTPQGVA